MPLEKGKVYIYGDDFPVYITHGKYTIHGRVSNFFYWKRIKTDGTLSELSYSRYDNKGMFSKFPGKYTVEIKINLVKSKI